MRIVQVQRSFYALLICAAATISLRAQTLSSLVVNSYADGIVQATDGNFWGTNSGTGPAKCGTIFKMTPVGALTTVYTFGCDLTTNPDGDEPGALMEGKDGNFYGLTFNGGANQKGSVFKLTPAGDLTVLASFNQTDGAEPVGLTQGSDGNFYGATYAGGPSDWGTLFKMTPDGTLTTLHNFDFNDGAQPYAGVTEGTDGKFYGVTYSGGAYGGGSFYSITSDATFTLIYSFGEHTYDPSGPTVLLAKAGDGNFYGTSCFLGSALNYGAVFQLTPSGGFTQTYTFTDQSDGYCPGGVTLGSDGALYGSSAGGSYSEGVIYKITTSGVFSVVYSLKSGDGYWPYGLVQATDGAFYGLTQGASRNSLTGTIFALSNGPVLPLNVSLAGPGSGVVTSSPAGLNCPTVCTANFNSPAPIRLSAIPATGSGFHGWTGACTGTGACSFLLTSAKSLTATFVAGSTTSVKVGPASTVGAGTSVTLTAQVSHSMGKAAPTGTVTFFSGGTVLNSTPAQLNSSGVATFTTSDLSGGSHPITAIYSGDNNYAASTAPATQLTVVDFTIAANPAGVTISAAGGSGMTTLTLTPLGGFSENVTYTCSGLPSGATCAFAAGKTADTQTMTIQTTGPSAAMDRVMFGKRMWYGLLLPFLMGLIMLPRKKTSSSAGSMCLLAVMFVSMLWLSACGGGGSGMGGSSGTPAGTNNITVSAASSGTYAITHSVPVTLTVQ
jgi:uncharacterized repeat protein (TIGR03803 family)